VKVYLEFEVLKGICYDMADRIAKWKPDYLVAISRGGTVPGTLIAKRLKMQLDYYIPAKKHITCHMGEGQRVVFIEDLVAQGRTLDQVRKMMKLDFPLSAWSYAPVLVDAKYNGKFAMQGMTTSAWIVFPWEENEKVVEGDRGLFREGTDQYE
jgi:hypoxanthine phosphoribosyltransferase